jgi:hypothetical protein
LRLTTLRVTTATSLGQHAAQDLLDPVELGLPADQRRGELDDRVTAVVGAAGEAGGEQCALRTARRVGAAAVVEDPGTSPRTITGGGFCS